MTVLNLQVANSGDDADEAGGGDVTIVQTGQNCDASDEFLGFRWRSVTIPQGSSISSAILSLTIQNSTLDEPDHTFWGENVDNAGIFVAGTATFTISARAKTTASVAWASADLGSGTNQFFSPPDVKTLVQEIVDRTGWASGNSMVIFCSSTNNTGTRDLGVTFFDSSSAFGAKLDVTYTVPTGGDLDPFGVFGIFGI